MVINTVYLFMYAESKDAFQQAFNHYTQNKTDSKISLKVIFLHKSYADVLYNFRKFIDAVSCAIFLQNSKKMLLRISSR